MVEEASVARTQVVQPVIALRCVQEAVLRALPIAHVPDLAGPAVGRQGLKFGLPENTLLLTLEQLDQWGLADVPHPVCGIDKVVAGVEVSVVFDHGDVPADRPEDAEGMLLP